MTLEAIWSWITDHRTVVLVAAAATVAALGITAVLIRAARRDRLADVATVVAVVIATAFSAEGMWEVAREGLKLSVWQAVVLFAAAETAMTAEAARAKRRQRREGHPGTHAAAVWVIAAAAGIVAATNADGLVEVLVRLGVPLLAAWLWWQELTDGGRTVRPADAITWRLTPRRVLVWLRLAEPGERDVTTVDRERRLRTMTSVAYRAHQGWRPLRRFYGWRLARLSLQADPEMVTAMQRQLTQTYAIVDQTSPEHLRSTKSMNSVHDRSTAVVHHLVQGQSTTGPRGRQSKSTGGSTTSSTKQSTDGLGAAECVERAVEAWTPGTTVTGAWIQQATGAKRSTAYNARPKVIAQLKAMHNVSEAELTGESTAGSTPQSMNGSMNGSKAGV